MGGLLDTILAPFSDEPEAGIPAPDFPNGLVIEELPEDGTLGLMVKLLNHMLPKVPFSFGGEQFHIKEYYAGNEIPAIQVLGSREDDLVLKGSLKDKKFKTSFKDDEFSKTISDLLSDIRRRGYICRMTLGDYVWHGLLSKTHFDMTTRRKYDYELTFTVMALDTIPNQCPMIGSSFEDVSVYNDKLMSLYDQMVDTSIPDDVPLSIGDALNKAIGGVASVIAGVTGFVDAILSNVSDIQKSVTRAVGLVTNAKTTAFKWGIELGKISYALQLAGVKVKPQYKLSSYVPESTYQGYQAMAQINAASFISSRQAIVNDTVSYLERLRERFATLKKTVPKARYLVKAETETLQQISVKFYGTVDNWSDIKKHNKLDSTVLTSGQVLEIPNV